MLYMIVLGLSKRTVKEHQLYGISVQSRDIELLNVEVKCDRRKRRNRIVKNQILHVIVAANLAIFLINV